MGTTFDDHTYFNFFRMAEIKTALGGVCHEIEVKWNWRSPLVISQFIDYKLKEVLKSAEGLYGLI